MEKEEDRKNNHKVCWLVSHDTLHNKKIMVLVLLNVCHNFVISLGQMIRACGDAVWSSCSYWVCRKSIDEAHWITSFVPTAVREELFIGKVFNDAGLSCVSVGQSQRVFVAVQLQLDHITFAPQSTSSCLDGFSLKLHVSRVSSPAVCPLVIIRTCQKWLCCNAYAVGII